MGWTEWLMIFLGLKLMVAVAATLWSMSRGKDRRATVCAAITLVYLALFAWAQTRAESEHELRHTAEHRAAQEQVGDVRRF